MVWSLHGYQHLLLLPGPGCPPGQCHLLGTYGQEDQPAAGRRPRPGGIKIVKIKIQ